MEKDICKQLLSEVSRIYKDKGTLTNDILQALQFVYQSPLLPALDLLDNNKVSRLSSPSGRYVYQVLGSSGTPYICLSTANYCSCAAFKFSVLKKNDHITCKHLLAIKLGVAMGTVTEQVISNEELTDVMQQIE